MLKTNQKPKNSEKVFDVKQIFFDDFDPLCLTKKERFFVLFKNHVIIEIVLFLF